MPDFLSQLTSIFGPPPPAPPRTRPWPTRDEVPPSAQRLEDVLSALAGVLGLPGVEDNRAYRGGELLSAAAPLMGVVKGLSAAKTLEGAAQKGITAYHGSPHDFDKFALEKIGTGEGAQAFGHGLYFAENEDVASQYRHMLARKSGTEGRTYEVRINADPNTMLDWDVPINQQSPEVRERLQPIIDYMKSRPLQPHILNKINDGTAKGRELYLWYSGERTLDAARETWPNVPKRPAAVGSKALREHGIPGMKYKDALSRRAGLPMEPTRNYVIFDDSIIDILKKYGLLPAAMAGGYLAQHEQPR